MRRFWGLFGILCVTVALVGCCGTLRYTAGICDCAPPPVETLLQPVQLPPHLCPQPQACATPPARMPMAGH